MSTAPSRHRRFATTSRRPSSASPSGASGRSREAPMSTQREDVAKLATDRWHSLLPQLGVSPRHLTRRHCACPMCGGTDRFRYDNKEGRGTWICNQCGAGDGFDLAMRVTGMGFADLAERVRELVQNVQPDKAKQKPEISPEQQRRALISMYQASN